MAKLTIKQESARKIDEQKLALEAIFIPKFKKIFKNIANDAKSLYLAKKLEPEELANNYHADFLKEIRDMYRRVIKEFGYNIRDTLEKKYFFNFDSENKKQYLDLEYKASVNINDSNLEEIINQINNSFNISATFFIANESENQTDFIVETSAKEIALSVNQEEQFFATQIAQRTAQLDALSAQISTLPEAQANKIRQQIATARANLRNQVRNSEALIAKNIEINLLDRAQSRSDLIASQNVGLSESWAKQTEGELVNDVDLVTASGSLLKITKTWVTILDSRTREEHVAADLQQVLIDEDFIVGGERLSYPRDPRGSAANIMNCRCLSEQGISTQTKSFEYKAADNIDLTPTQEMANNATRALMWREEFGRGGTAVGVARARDLKNRKRLSPETVGRMVSFFARHEVDKKAEGFNKGEDGFPSNGRIAWDLWGGDAGKSWAESKWKVIKQD